MDTATLKRATLFAIVLAAIVVASCVSNLPPEASTVPDSIEPPQSLRRLTLVEEPGPLGVGQRLSLPECLTIDGARLPALSLAVGRKALVFVMTSTGCPVSMSYGPRLAAIESEYGTKNIGFAYVNSVAAETPDEMRQQIRDFGFKGPYMPDRDRAIAGALGPAGGARTTTEVFVLDAALTLVYRGAIDDRFGVGATLDAPRRQFLRDALDAVLAGETPKIGATWPPGCLLDRSTPHEAPAKQLTYFGRISRILDAACVECHRPQGSAPFSLASYQSIQGRVSMIEAMVNDGLMPPSHSRPPLSHTTLPTDLHHPQNPNSTGPWSTPRGLSAEERDDLLTWLRSNRPVGTFAEAPVAQERPQGWAIGTPESLLTAGQMQLPIDGPMQHERFFVPTNVKTDRWIQAIELRPMKQELLHHAVVWIVPPGRMLPELDAAVDGATDIARIDSRPERGLELLATYSPGHGVVQYEAGVGRRVPAGSVLVVDLYARPMGKIMNTSLRIGIQFAKEPPELEASSLIVQCTNLKIKAGELRARNSADLKLDREVTVLSITPYMRARGRSLMLEATANTNRSGMQAGESRRLLDVTRYDPRWVIRYEYADPLTLAAGSTLRLSGVHNNSADNPNNPDAGTDVRTGARASDEALFAALEILTPVSRPLH